MSRDIPIIFSAPMVRALLAGRKTQTRRLALRSKRIEAAETSPYDDSVTFVPSLWQRVKPGDRLWVRESLEIGEGCIDYAADGEECSDLSTSAACALFDRRKYDDDRIGGASVPSIHMPRWASRLTLIVTGGKIERLRSISDADAIAEGLRVEPGAAIDLHRGGHIDGYFVELPDGREIGSTLGPATVFGSLWKALHGDESWAANPEVVALTFTVHACNIDQMKESA